MKTILVPLDFSAVSGEIVDSAINFARSRESEVVLLHVVQPPTVTSEFGLPAAAIEAALAASERAASTKLEEFVHLFRSAGVSAEPVVRRGQPVTAILDEANRIQAELIVMGSQGHGSIYDLLVGSTANGVMRKARCGVYILPPANRRAKVAVHEFSAG